MAKYFIRFPSNTRRDQVMFDLSQLYPDLYARSQAGEFPPDIIVTDPSGEELQTFTNWCPEAFIIPDETLQLFHPDLEKASEEINYAITRTFLAQEALKAPTLESNPVIRLIQYDLERSMKYAKAANRVLETAKKL